MGQPDAAHRRARLKVTGEARYALRFAGRQSGLCLPGHQRRSRGAASPGIDLARGAGGPRRARHLHPREHRRASSDASSFAGGGGAATSIAPLGPTGSSTTARSSRMVLADTFEAAREAAYTVEVDLRRRTAARAGFDAGARRRPPRPRRPSGTRKTRQVGDAEAAFAAADGAARGRLRDADPAPQPDRAVHHHLRLERRPADRLRAEPVRLRPASNGIAAAARHRPRQGAGGQPLSSAAPSARKGR